MLRLVLCIRFALSLCLFSVAGAHSALSAPKPQVAGTASEQRAVRSFNRAAENPLQLTAFLANMPKGGDLHMHLSGAVYAENFIRQAASDGLCYSPASRSFFKPSATTRSLPPQPVCGEGNRRAEEAFKDQVLYDALVLPSGADAVRRLRDDGRHCGRGDPDGRRRSR